MGGNKRKQTAGTTATATAISQEETKLAEQVFGEAASAKPSAKVTTRHAGRKLQPAWVDEDDEQVEVQLDDAQRLRKLRRAEHEVVDGSELQQRLKKQFQSGHGSVAWADPARFLDPKPEQDLLSDSEDEEEEAMADVVRSTGKMLAGAQEVLMPGTLDICRVKDANQHAPSNAAIQSVEFHPNGQLLLSAGLDKTLHLFNVDGTMNTTVENVFVKDLPILHAQFTLQGERIVLSGPRSYYFSYDVQAGKISKIPRILGRERERRLEKFVVSKAGDRIVFLGSDGYLSLLSAKTYETEGHMKMNGSATSAAFCENDRYLISTGSDGEVYKWDLRTQKCVSVHHDEGSLGNLSIAASGDSKFYATGSTSGVVNVYDNGGVSATTRPRKSLMQLTTQIDHLLFNPDSQLLVMASRESRDALKMIHLPSFTVFTNWPANKTPLNYVTSMGFSPSSGYFAVGNARGRVLLYRLTHYGST